MSVYGVPVSQYPYAPIPAIHEQPNLYQLHVARTYLIPGIQAGLRPSVMTTKYRKRDNNPDLSRTGIVVVVLGYSITSHGRYQLKATIPCLEAGHPTTKFILQSQPGWAILGLGYPVNAS